MQTYFVVGSGCLFVDCDQDVDQDFEDNGIVEQYLVFRLGLFPVF